MAAFFGFDISNKHLTLLLLLVITIGLVVLLHLRGRWIPKFRAWLSRRRINGVNYNVLPSFQDDIEQGLTSNQFDLRENNSNDARKGLDEAAKNEILKIMKDKNISFDDARLRYTRGKLSENNIGPDGVPLDPRTVTFGKR